MLPRPVSELSDAAFGRLAAVGSRRLSVVFFLGILAYTVVLLAEAMTYSADARLFPIIVGVALVAMTVAKVLLLVGQIRVDRVPETLFETAERFDIPETREAVDTVTRYKREFGMVVWLAVLFELIWLFGHMVALALFVFFSIYSYERSVQRAAIAAGLTYGFVYALFIELLGAPLWDGVVELGLMLP